MEVNRLKADELAYELRVRGAPENGTVDERRSRLRQRLYLEKHGSFSQSFCFDLDGDAEIAICDVKLNELAMDILSFDKDNAKNERSRILTRLLHVSGRLSRVAAEGLRMRKDALISKCVQLCENLDKLSLPPEARIGADQQEDHRNELIDLTENVNSEPVGAQGTITQAFSQDFIEQPSRQVLSEVNDVNNHNSRRVSFQVSTMPSTIENAHQVPASSSPRNNQEVPLHLDYSHHQVDPNLHQSIYRNSISGNIAGTSSGAIPRSSSVRNTITPSMREFENQIRNLNIHEDERIHQTQASRLHSCSHCQSEDSTSRNFNTVSRWNLTFNGHNMSVMNFIERVEELRVACNIPKCQLIKFAPILLAGTPLNWFRTTEEKLDTWDDVTWRLKEIYLSSFYDDDVWTDIRSRTQGQNETCATYIINMESLFNKLKNRPRELERVNIIRERMLPHIQMRLPLEPIPALSELSKYSRWIENIHIRTQRLRPPPTNRNLVTEAEFMYDSRRYSRLEALTFDSPDNDGGKLEDRPRGCAADSSARNSIELIEPKSPARNKLQCYNCSNQGHFANRCPHPKRRYCYRCGQPNETVRTCKNCSGNGRPSHDPAEP